jgi:peroxiredoxin
LRSFEKHREAFDRRGVRIVAISVDPPETTRELAGKQGYAFTLLSDPNAEVIGRYGVLHPKAGPGGSDLARPAEFLVDAGGVIRWVNLTESYAARARPAQALEAIDEALQERSVGR